MTKTQHKSKTAFKRSIPASEKREPIRITERKTSNSVISNVFSSQIQNKVFMILAGAVLLTASINLLVSSAWIPAVVLILSLPSAIFATYYALSFYGKKQRHKKGISPTLAQSIYEHHRINGRLNPIKLAGQFWRGEEVLSRDFYEIQNPDGSKQ